MIAIIFSPSFVGGGRYFCENFPLPQVGSHGVTGAVDGRLTLEPRRDHPVLLGFSGRLTEHLFQDIELFGDHPEGNLSAEGGLEIEAGTVEQGLDLVHVSGFQVGADFPGHEVDQRQGLGVLPGELEVEDDR